jgi:homoserine/homoserine lactone efflux protein
VAYLVYLAIKQWQQRPSEIKADIHAVQRVRALTMIVKGFLINISNPKAIVFMLAVLPQFIDPQQELVPQYGIMMVTMIAVDMIVMAGYTCLAAKVLLFLRTPRQQRILNRSFASMFVGAASLLSFVHR